MLIQLSAAHWRKAAAHEAELEAHHWKAEWQEGVNSETVGRPDGRQCCIGIEFDVGSLLQSSNTAMIPKLKPKLYHKPSVVSFRFPSTPFSFLLFSDGRSGSPLRSPFVIFGYPWFFSRHPVAFYKALPRFQLGLSSFVNPLCFILGFLSVFYCLRIVVDMFAFLDLADMHLKTFDKF